MCFCCYVVVFGLLSDPTLEIPFCYKSPNRGVHLWTAGHLMHRELGIWDWKLYSPTKQIRPSVSPEPRELWTYSFMDYTVWTSGQPDNAGGNEACVNIWPVYSYQWNDARCDQAYCFVCEDRDD